MERHVRVRESDLETTAILRLHVWPVIAGVVVSLAVGGCLLAVGGAIGVTAARPSESLLRGLSIGFLAWTLATLFTAALLGAWVTGLFARTPTVRDGMLHGLVVWAVLMVLSTSILANVVQTAIVRAGGTRLANSSSLPAILGAWGVVAAMLLPLGGALVGGWAGARREVRHFHAARRVVETGTLPRETDVHHETHVPVT
jgi:hypothetical protein